MLIEYLNETYLNITFAYVFKHDFEMTYQNSFNLLLFMFLCLQFCCLKRSLIINTIRNLNFLGTIRTINVYNRYFRHS